MCRIRPSQLPARHHRTALSAVHGHHRRVRDHIHDCGSDAFPRIMRHVAASRPGEEKKQSVPQNQRMAHRGQQQIQRHDLMDPASLKAYVCGIRRHSGRNIHNEPDRTRKFHAQGRPGILHCGA